MMCYDYDNIVREWFEDLKQPFINYIRHNFDMSYDEVMDLYTDVWIQLRRIILEGRATDNKWKALLFTIGFREALKRHDRRPRHVSIDSEAEDDERFNPVRFEMEKALRKMEAKSVYEDPDLRAVLASELEYIPDKCNKILRFFYFEGLSMTEIAETLNFSNSRSAITIKKRCLDKLKFRVKNAMHLLSKIS